MRLLNPFLISVTCIECVEKRMAQIIVTGENIDWFHNDRRLSLQIKVEKTHALDSSNRRRSIRGFGCWIWNGLSRWQSAVALVVCCKARRPHFRRRCQNSGCQVFSSGMVSRWTLNSWVGMLMFWQNRYQLNATFMCPRTIWYH